MSVPRIDRLTEEQIAAMPGWAERWIKIGLSTDRADWAGFERGARECYRLAGLAPPKAVVRCASPLGAALAVPVVASHLADPKASVEVSVWASVSASVWASVRDSVSASVWASVWASVRDSVRDSVRASVRASVEASVEASVGDSVWDSVRDSVGDSVGALVEDSIGGQFWVEWQAIESFYHDVCGLDSGKRAEAEAYRLAQSSACWWFPRAGFITVSDRPLVIHQERIADSGWGSVRLHCEDGPAMAWPDGFAIHAWHGTVVKKHVIEAPDTISLSEIKAEQNAEIRRVLRERYGDGRYLQDTGAILVDADIEGARKGAAPRALLRDHDGDLWLVGTDGSTRRTYYMPIEGDIKTCRAAHESICGFTETSIENKS